MPYTSRLQRHCISTKLLVILLILLVPLLLIVGTFLLPLLLDLINIRFSGLLRQCILEHVFLVSAHHILTGHVPLMTLCWLGAVAAAIV